MKIENKYFLFYFLFTIVFNVARSSYPSITILHNPAAEIFFSVTGIIALIAFIGGRKPKKKKKQNACNPISTNLERFLKEGGWL